MHELRFSVILYGLAWLLRATAWRSPKFRARLKELNFTAQLKTYDDGVGRWYEFRDGKILTGAGIRKDAEAVLSFKTAKLAAHLLMPPIDWLEQINALKEFMIKIEGDEKYSNWFAQTVMMTQHVHWEYGTQNAGRLAPHLQHDQWRAGLRLHQGRQDRAHDADRPRRRRRRVLDHRGARQEVHPAAARPPSRRTARTPSRSSIRPTGCSIR